MCEGIDHLNAVIAFINRISSIQVQALLLLSSCFPRPCLERKVLSGGKGGGNRHSISQDSAIEGFAIFAYGDYWKME